MDELLYDEPWYHPHERKEPAVPDPLAVMQSIIDAYKDWRCNPTVESWTELDRVVRYADAYAREVEAKLAPIKANLKGKEQ